MIRGRDECTMPLLTIFRRNVQLIIDDDRDIFYHRRRAFDLLSTCMARADTRRRPRAHAAR